MPTAPNEIVIYNFEENIEKAALSAIADFTGIDGIRSNDDTELPEFSVAVEFTLGAATGNMQIKPGTADPARKEYSEYTGILEIQLRANRPTVAASGTSGIDTRFSEMRAKLRVLFQESNWPLNDTNLPYYRLSMLKHSGTVSGISAETETDIATLRYDLKFAIRKDVWPAGS